MPPRVRRALTAADVHAAAEARRDVLVVPARTVVTPLARDLARERGVELVPEGDAGGRPGDARAGSSGPGGEVGGAGGGTNGAGPGEHGRARVPGGGPADADGSADVESRVRSIVASLLGAGGGAGRVLHVPAAASSDLPPFPHPGPGPDQDVRARDVVSAADGAPMAAGFLTLTRGEFPWTLTYDEIQYVVEGELHVTVPEGRVVGRQGDVLYVPRGTSITFGTPSWAKFLYVTFPANWEDAP